MKLCVGCSSIEKLVTWVGSGLVQNRCWEKPLKLYTIRMISKRLNKLTGNSALYWIIKGNIQCRQHFLDIKPFTDEEGINRCHLCTGTQGYTNRVATPATFSRLALS